MTQTEKNDFVIISVISINSTFTFTLLCTYARTAGWPEEETGTATGKTALKVEA